MNCIEYIKELKNLSEFGFGLTLKLKLQKHLKRNDVKAMRTYTALAIAARPGSLEDLWDLLDRNLIKRVKLAYVPNSKWVKENSINDLFIKIKEPPLVI